MTSFKLPRLINAILWSNNGVMNKTVPLTASRSDPKFSVWRPYCRRYYPARSSSNMPWLDQWISKLSRQNNRDNPLITDTDPTIIHCCNDGIFCHDITRPFHGYKRDIFLSKQWHKQTLLVPLVHGLFTFFTGLRFTAGCCARTRIRGNGWDQGFRFHRSDGFHHFFFFCFLVFHHQLIDILW